MNSTYDNIITSYNVLAKSERIDIVTKGELNSKWNISNGKIFTISGQLIESKFSGSIDAVSYTHLIDLPNIEADTYVKLSKDLDCLLYTSRCV